MQNQMASYQDGLSMQRNQLNADLEAFNIEYLDRLSKVSISDADRRFFQQTFEDLNGNIAKNRANI